MALWVLGNSLVKKEWCKSARGRHWATRGQYSMKFVVLQLNMNCSTVDIPFLSEALSGERIWVILKVANIMRRFGDCNRRRRRRMKKKVNLKICLARKLNAGLQLEHWPLHQGEIFKIMYVFRNISLQLSCSRIFSILSTERPLAIRH